MKRHKGTSTKHFCVPKCNSNSKYSDKIFFRRFQPKSKVADSGFCKASVTLLFLAILIILYFKTIISVTWELMFRPCTIVESTGKITSLYWDTWLFIALVWLCLQIQNILHWKRHNSIRLVYFLSSWVWNFLCKMQLVSLS